MYHKIQGDYNKPMHTVRGLFPTKWILTQTNLKNKGE